MASKIRRGAGRDGATNGSQDGARGTDGTMTGSEPIRASVPRPPGVEDLDSLKERIQKELLEVRGQGRAAGPAGRASDVAATEGVENLAWPSLDAPVPPPYFDAEPPPDAGAPSKAMAASKPPVFAATLLGLPIARGGSSQVANQTPPRPPPQTLALVLRDGAVPALIDEYDPTTVNPIVPVGPTAPIAPTATVALVAHVEAQEISEEQGFSGHLPWYEQSPRTEEVLEQPEKKRSGRTLLGLGLGLMLAIAAVIAVRQALMGPPAPSAARGPAGVDPVAPPAIAPAAAPSSPSGTAALSPPIPAPIVVPPPSPAPASSASDEPDPSATARPAASPSGLPSAPRAIGTVDRPAALPRRGSAISNSPLDSPSGGTPNAQPRQHPAATAPAKSVVTRSVVTRSGGAADKPRDRPRAPTANASSSAAPAPSSSAPAPAAPASPESSPPKAPAEKLKGKPNYDPDSTLPLNVE